MQANHADTMEATQPNFADLIAVQRMRKAVLLAGIALCVVFLFFGTSRWPGGTLVHEAIEWTGIALIVIAIVGRTWSSLYIGGRKVSTLVDTGPYSITRNPLYAFSILGAAGAGAQLGSVVMALAGGLMAWIVFLIVVRREEQVLIGALGAPYTDYTSRVPRFLPNIVLWRDSDSLVIRPSIIIVTFFDALLFFLAIPLAEGVEYLHELDLLLNLIQLP